MAHRHLRHHCHDHHVVLTLPHQTIRRGVLSREEWLCVTTTTTKICAELWKTPFAQLIQKCSDVCHRGHGGESVCVSSIRAHTRIHWTCNQGLRDPNQIILACWWVYGNFSPILYICTNFKYYNTCEYTATVKLQYNEGNCYGK